jgi:hypothetical protein
MHKMHLIQQTDMGIPDLNAKMTIRAEMSGSYEESYT